MVNEPNIAYVLSISWLPLAEPWRITTTIAAGGLSGGVASSMADGDFLDGLCNGLISSGLNHAMHLVCAAGENAVKKARASNAGPDDPPGGKNNQNTKQNNQNSQVNKDTQNVAEGAIYAGAGLTAVDGGLTVVGVSAKSIARVAIRRVGVGGIIVSEYSDFNEFIQDPNLGKGTKLFVGVGLGVASVFCSPIIATAAFTLGVVNSCGGFDKLYDKLNR
ncbi:MAG: hypothetical protein MJZ97_01695 [Bacteroidales bacterium]|nr:hypothetical protein [Bacteroidales bacterium]